MIYSTKFDSLSNLNTVLRSTHDPTNSPNATSRSTHDLRQTATNALGIDTQSHDEPGKPWYYLLRARCNNQWEAPINRERHTREVPKRQEQINKKESQTQYLTRFDNLPTSSGQGRERSYWFNNQLQVTSYNPWGLYPFIYNQRVLEF